MLSEKIDKAWDFALEKHEKSLGTIEGRKYFFNHIFVVYHILENINAPENSLCAALLHDTIEDTDTTYEELVTEFGSTIADLVMEVTHEGEKDSKGYYFPRLKSKEAITIKFADRLSNLTRISEWDQERQDQYLRRSKFWRSE